MTRMLKWRFASTLIRSADHAPVYRPGRYLTIDDKPVAVGDDCLLVHRRTGEQAIGTLWRLNRSRVSLHQWNRPPNPLGGLRQFPRSQWSRPILITGWAKRSGAGYQHDGNSVIAAAMRPGR